jgi:hypothetical protein
MSKPASSSKAGSSVFVPRCRFLATRRHRYHLWNSITGGFDRALGQEKKSKEEARYNDKQERAAVQQ